MRIFFLTMDDPVQTIPFLKKVIRKRKEQVIGVAVVRGDRLTIGKKRSKVVYLLSLLLIMGIVPFISASFKEIWFKLNKWFSRKTDVIKCPSILTFAGEMGIENTFNINNPNSVSFLEELRKLRPDIIINQSQYILKNDILDIPRIGTINRHNALLPKNRGRLTPFWVLYNGEKKTGVSIHFVEERLDSGDIIIQKKIPVSDRETFNSLVKKNYEIAPGAMLEALAKLEAGNKDFIKNDDEKATYNTIPTLKQAFFFRIMIIRRNFRHLMK